MASQLESIKNDREKLLKFKQYLSSLEEETDSVDLQTTLVRPTFLKYIDENLDSLNSRSVGSSARKQQNNSGGGLQ